VRLDFGSTLCWLRVFWHFSGQRVCAAVLLLIYFTIGIIIYQLLQNCVTAFVPILHHHQYIDVLDDE
jgi:hypothetical protein